MNPEDVTPREISQTQKDKRRVVPLSRGTWSRRLQPTHTGGGCQAGEGDGRWCLMGTGSVREDGVREMVARGPRAASAPNAADLGA